MIRKVTAIIFAIMFMLSAVAFIPKHAEADTFSFKVNVSTEMTQKYEKIHLSMPRKLDGATFSHILGKDTNKGNIIFIGKQQLSDKTEFIITPLKCGSFDFAIGLYHYNGSSTDMVLSGILNYHVDVKARSNGRLYVSNLSTTFATSGNYSVRSKAETRYDLSQFKKLQVKFSNNTITYTITAQDISTSTIKSTAKTYKLENYYLVNGRHVHAYNKSGVCTVCGLKSHDYTTGVPLLFGKCKAPENGQVYTIKPKTADGKVVNAPVQVYLPYGYKSTNKYNVVFLFPGAKGTINNWTSSEFGVKLVGGSSVKFSGRQLFDWLIYTGQAAPFIAVSGPMQPPASGNYDEMYPKYISNITDYWLPMIIDGKGEYTDSTGVKRELKFGGTYAKSSKEADIKAARMHFAIEGLSQGASFVSKHAVDPTSPLGKRFGNVIVMSGFIRANVMEEKYNKDKNNKSMLYFVTGGTTDKSGGGSAHTVMLNYLKNDTLKKFPFFIMDGGHKWDTWFRGFAAVFQTAMK